MRTLAREADTAAYKGQASDCLYSYKLGYSKNRRIRDSYLHANFEAYKCKERNLWWFVACPEEPGSIFSKFVSMWKEPLHADTQMLQLNRCQWGGLNKEYSGKSHFYEQSSKPWQYKSKSMSIGNTKNAIIYHIIYIYTHNNESLHKDEKPCSIT